jgi:hypothetical protein
MKSEIFLIFALVAAIMSPLALVNLDSTNAQNTSMDGNITTATNMTNDTIAGNVTGGNMTASDTLSNSAKFHLEEGIKALQSGDT